MRTKLETLNNLVTVHLDRRSANNLEAIAAKARALKSTNRHHAEAVALRAEAAVRFVAEARR